RQSGAQAAGQIEEQVTKVAEAVFNVIAENCQAPHVEDQVEHGAVEEHGSKQRKQGLGRGLCACQPGIYVSRDKCKSFENAGTLDKLPQEYQSIQPDQEVGNKRGSGVRRIVADGEHAVSAAS